MEDLGSVFPFVQILDLLVPQMVDYVADALRILDLPMAEQVIEVPKISCSACPSRSLLPEPQSAEQLVEVPTVLSPLRNAEQIVGIPVPRGRGKRQVQGSLPGQSTTATHSSGKRISERIVEQIVGFPRLSSRSLTFLLVVALGRVRPHLQVLQMRILLGFFALFSMEKSAEYQAGDECAAGWARQLIHAERSSNASCPRRFALGLCGAGAVLRHGASTSGTDAPVRPLGSHRRASSSSGSDDG